MEVAEFAKVVELETCSKLVGLTKLIKRAEPLDLAELVEKLSELVELAKLMQLAEIIKKKYENDTCFL